MQNDVEEIQEKVGFNLFADLYTATSDDATANQMEVDTKYVDATGFIVQVFRADVNVSADVVVTLTAGVLNVADGSTYSVITGDKLHYIVF